MIIPPSDRRWKYGGYDYSDACANLTVQIREKMEPLWKRLQKASSGLTGFSLQYGYHFSKVSDALSKAAPATSKSTYYKRKALREALESTGAWRTTYDAVASADKAIWSLKDGVKERQASLSYSDLEEIYVTRAIERLGAAHIGLAEAKALLDTGAVSKVLLDGFEKLQAMVDGSEMPASDKKVLKKLATVATLNATKELQKADPEIHVVRDELSALVSGAQKKLQGPFRDR